MIDEKAFTAARAAYPQGMNVPHSDCLRAAIIAYESAKQKGEAEGWVLVPRELSSEMRAAVWRDQYRRHGEGMPVEAIEECVRRKMEDPEQEAQDRSAYRAMLSAGGEG